MWFFSSTDVIKTQDLQDNNSQQPLNETLESGFQNSTEQKVSLTFTQTLPTLLKKQLSFDKKREVALTLFDTWAKDFYSKLGLTAGGVFYVQWTLYQSSIRSSQSWSDLSNIFENDKKTIESYQEHLEGDALESLKALGPQVDQFLVEYAPEK